MASVGSLVVSLIAETADFISGMKRAEDAAKHTQSVFSGIGSVTMSGVDLAGQFGMATIGKESNAAADGIALLTRTAANLFSGPVGWAEAAIDIGTFAYAASEADAAERAAIKASWEHGSSMQSLTSDLHKATQAQEARTRAIKAEQDMRAFAGAGRGSSSSLAFEISTFGMDGPERAVAEYRAGVREWMLANNDAISQMSEAEKNLIYDEHDREAERIRSRAAELESLHQQQAEQQRAADEQRSIEAELEAMAKEADQAGMTADEKRLDNLRRMAGISEAQIADAEDFLARKQQADQQAIKDKQTEKDIADRQRASDAALGKPQLSGALRFGSAAARNATFLSQENRLLEELKTHTSLGRSQLTEQRTIAKATQSQFKVVNRI